MNTPTREGAQASRARAKAERERQAAAENEQGGGGAGEEEEAGESVGLAAEEGAASRAPPRHRQRRNA
eukprot:1710706-Pleurochrysis_carterae.AAC.1